MTRHEGSRNDERGSGEARLGEYRYELARVAPEDDGGSFADPVEPSTWLLEALSGAQVLT